MHAAMLSLSLLATAPDGSTADAAPPLPPPRSALSAQAPADAPSLPPLPMPRDPLPTEPAPEAPAPEAPVPSPTGASALPVSSPSPQPSARAPVQPPTAAAGLPVSQPSAQPLASPVIPPPRGAGSYTTRLLLTDAVAWSLAAAALNVNSDANVVMGLLGFGTLALGAPFVHLANHHPGRALGSLALRAGGLVAGLLTAKSATGVVVAFATAELVDVVALGSLDQIGRKPSRGALAVTPVLAPTPGGGLLGLAATF